MRPELPQEVWPGDGEPAVRRAGRRDRATLESLWLDLIGYHRDLDPTQPVPGALRESLLRELDRALQSSLCCICLAEVDDRPAGFVLAEIEAGRTRARSGWIHELYVVEGLRRRGIGAALVRCAQAFLESQGATRPSVRVVSGNRTALRFWRRAGFVERARILELERGPGPDAPRRRAP